MSLKLTAASFLNGVKSSGLVDGDTLESVTREMRAAGSDASDSRAIASELIRRELVTSWQADKLLQGRHKGFFLGRYRLMRLLGTGQMSAVYLGRHILMDHLCAIKVLPADKVGDTSYLGRFYREAKAVAALNHPNVIRAFDVDKQVEAGTEIHFLVMEYVEGKPLTKLVEEKDDHHIDLILAVDAVRQAAEGLAHAHAFNMVHRDIKPDNLLVNDRGEVKILDLGLARFFKTTDEESLTLKHDERVIGTADYLAPEQAIDSHSVDSRADIYGLGCTFYYALTGHPPFTEGTLVQRLMAHQSQPVPPVTNERPDVPESLTKILERMLAKKAADRYQTARELADDLTAWLLEFASDEWKEQHLPLYAALRLRDMMKGDVPAFAGDITDSSGETSNLKSFASGTHRKDSAIAAMANNLKSQGSTSNIAKRVADLDAASPSPTTARTKSSPGTKATAATKAADPASTKAATGKPTKSNLVEETASLRAAAKMGSVIRKDEGGIIGVLHRHPAASIAIGIVATVLAIAAGVILLRPDRTASAKDRSQTTGEPSRTAQSTKESAR